MPERTDADNDRANNDRADKDRRRDARFSCGGYATISCLPSDGILLLGQIRDLSLGGCCVNTALPIGCGVRAELVVRVNAASFRALGEVRAIRGRSGACMEFVRLSPGGKDMLSDLIKELERAQAVVDRLKSARRDLDEKSFGKQLEEGQIQALRLRKRFPLFGTIRPAESSELDQAASDGKDRIAEAQPLVVPVDLFG
jgi:PilZ domain